MTWMEFRVLSSKRKAARCQIGVNRGRPTLSHMRTGTQVTHTAPCAAGPRINTDSWTDSSVHHPSFLLSFCFISKKNELELPNCRATLITKKSNKMKIHCVDRLQFGAGIEFQRFFRKQRKQFLSNFPAFFSRVNFFKKKLQFYSRTDDPCKFFQPKKNTRTHTNATRRPRSSFSKKKMKAVLNLLQTFRKFRE